MVPGESPSGGPESSSSGSEEPTTSGTPDRLVFVTSRVVRGNFAAEFGGHDGLCNLLADEAGLAVGGAPHFKAWLATKEQDAVERIEHSPGRYVLVSGETFAESWDALVAGLLQHPLSVDERGYIVNELVWTDTMPNGHAVQGTHCEDWTSKGDHLEAAFGYSSDADGQWTHVVDGTSPALCGSSAALYCIESGAR